MLKKYDFEIKYRANNLNFVDDSSRRSNYENEKFDDVCFSILQNKLQNIVITNIEITNLNVEKTIKNENDNDNKMTSISKKNLIKFSKQLIRKQKIQKMCENENIYENFTNKLIKKIKKIQINNKYFYVIMTKLKHVVKQTKRDVTKNKIIDDD